MKSKLLKEIIKKLKELDLVYEFHTKEELNDWLISLDKDKKAADNFLSLDLTKEQIKNLKSLVINLDYLKLFDYKERITMLSLIQDKVKYFDINNFNFSFLMGDNFFAEMNIMINNPELLRNCYIFISDISFIESPYHKEDLNLLERVIEESRKSKTKCDKKIDALLKVASNKESINSKYHHQDMELMSKIPEEYYEKYMFLEGLATNKTSLNDKYHCANMRMLINHKEYGEFLLPLMKDESIIKSEFYIYQIGIIANAKSLKTAKALYYKIYCPERIGEELDELALDANLQDGLEYFVSVFGENNVFRINLSCKQSSSYLKDLLFIRNANDEYVMHYTLLLTDINFVGSKYKKIDLKLLKLCEGKQNFIYLWKIFGNSNFLRSPYHIDDAILVSKLNITNKTQIDILLNAIVNENNIKSRSHTEDINFILNLDFTKIDDKGISEIRYYLFDEEGLKNPNRSSKLLEIKDGKIDFQKESSVRKYIRQLEEEIDSGQDDIKLKSTSHLKRVRGFFQKKNLI